jgi:hypothetical protein
MVKISAFAVARAVEVNHVQVRCALINPVDRRGERVVVVNLLAVVVALSESHGVTVANVYRGKKNHC